MNIQNINNGPIRPDQLLSDSVQGNARVGGPASAGAAGQGADADQDRVELSDAGLSAAGDPKKMQELTFARKALQSIPPMDESRTAELRQKVEEGYYSQPEVLQKVAERFTTELTGGQ